MYVLNTWREVQTLLSVCLLVPEERLGGQDFDQGGETRKQLKKGF